MKMRSSVALVAIALTAGWSGGVAAMPSASTQTAPAASTTPHNSRQQVTYFNKQGKEQSDPTRFAQTWGDASLGG
jgi:hypothetical protein